MNCFLPVISITINLKSPGITWWVVLGLLPNLTRLRDLVSVSQKDLRERFARESDEFMKLRENN